jgi:hypothetical protein
VSSKENKELHFPSQIIVRAIYLNGNSGCRWWKNRGKGWESIGVDHMDDTEAKGRIM